MTDDDKQTMIVTRVSPVLLQKIDQTMELLGLRSRTELIRMAVTKFVNDNLKKEN